MALRTDFTEVFAVPGSHSIIDGINPDTGLSMINGDSLEQVRLRYPTAERMTWEDWRAEQIAKQQTPITWSSVSERKYDEMLNILSPAAWSERAFLVGEPTDHCMKTGSPRYPMYRYRGSVHFRIYQASSRPVTVSEFRENR